MQIYEVSLTIVETVEIFISKYMKNRLGVSYSLTNLALYSSSTKLKLSTLSLVEEYKLSKALLFRMLRDSRNLLRKNNELSVIAGLKWEAKIAVENAESALNIKEIIGTVEIEEPIQAFIHSIGGSRNLQ